MMLLIVYYGIAVPLRIADFGSVKDAGLNYFDLATNLFFIVDIVLNFFTAYKEQGEIVFSKVKIRQRYLKSWFLVDVIASIPFELFTSASNSDVDER